MMPLGKHLCAIGRKAEPLSSESSRSGTCEALQWERDAHVSTVRVCVCASDRPTSVFYMLF